MIEIAGGIILAVVGLVLGWLALVVVGGMIWTTFEMLFTGLAYIAGGCLWLKEKVFP